MILCGPRPRAGVGVDNTMVYRETHDVRFLDFARKVSDVYLSVFPKT